MKSTPLNIDSCVPLSVNSQPRPTLSKQEHDMFVMKAISLMANEKIARTNLKNAPINVSESEGKIYCEQKIAGSGKVMTLKGAFKRMDGGRSLPIGESFNLTFS